MIAVVYLLWAPLGPRPVREFARAYRERAAGTEHHLVVVLNGGELGRRERLLGELEGIEHELLPLEVPVHDLDAYAQAAARLEHDQLCFLNSYATPLADEWLAKLTAALVPADVGLVSASGSWESQAEWRRGAITHWPKQLALLPGARRDFPRFPNPHLRTSSFMLERSLALELGLEAAVDKRSAYMLESGQRSITRQVRERGLRAVVVGRDGRSYDVEDWAASRTFRNASQENLLIADNQTRDYERASSHRRARLRRDTWGPSALSADTPQA